MGASQPFMYDAVPKNSSRYPYSNYDPRAVSRASLAPKATRPTSNGPLLNFNQHPDSWQSVPYGNTTATPMKPSMKKRIIQTRVALLVFRIFQLVGAIGTLVLFILLTGVPFVVAWIMRISAGIAALNTTYAVYHLSRKAAGRTPGSSASYQVFACAFDVTAIAFYAFGALYAAQAYTDLEKNEGALWSTFLENKNLTITFVGSAFLSTVITGSFHVISLGLGIWLAVIYRKIVNLSPDMNPLEDNLTSRHKRNKSEMTVSTMGEKRLSAPLESRRQSGDPYQDLSRPPTVPFLHTRTGSVESFSTLHSRDSRLDLPSRQYQIASISQSSLPRASTPNPNRSSPLKRASYTAVPLDNSPKDDRFGLKEAWFQDATISVASDARAQYRPTSSVSPRKGKYVPVSQDASANEFAATTSFPSTHPNPLSQNPLSMNPPRPKSYHHEQQITNPFTNKPLRNSGTPVASAIVAPNHSVDSISLSTHALSTLSNSQGNMRQTSSNYSGDLADVSTVSALTPKPSLAGSSNYSVVEPGSYENENKRTTTSGPGREMERDFSFTRQDQQQHQDVLKTRSYGELRAATPPVFLGLENSNGDLGDRRMGGDRQASSGNDYGYSSQKPWRRDVSGKIAEEGRGSQGWGTRFRKVSGI